MLTGCERESKRETQRNNGNSGSEEECVGKLSKVLKLAAEDLNPRGRGH